MHPKEAFKIGFLARCVEENLSPEDIHTRAKAAADYLEKQAGGWNPFTDATGAAKNTAETAKAVAGTVKDISIPLAILAGSAPILAGGGAAYFANKATDTDATDIQEIKNKELVETYRRMADQLRRQKQLRKYKSERKRTGRVFL